MPNALTAEGITTETREELLARYTAKYKEIYGDDINLDSNTPDGQMMNFQIQEVLDLEDFVVTVYNSMDPDQARGRVLDQRCAINGVIRKGGTYTITPITLVNSASVNLYGLDQENDENAQPVYTISDNAGTLWLLIDTVLGLAAGSHVLSFRAAEIGEQLTTPNTINVPVTIVLGVTSVNNPTVATTVGTNQQTDASLRVFRLQSVSRASQGFLPSLYAELLAIDGVNAVKILENTTNTTDDNDIPGHTIWVIVSGSPDEDEVAQAIYTKRNAGAGMKGEQVVYVDQPNDVPFPIRFDYAGFQNVFAKVKIEPIDPEIPPLFSEIRPGLADQLTARGEDSVNISAVSAIVQSIDPNSVVTECTLTDGRIQKIITSAIPASGAIKVCYKTGTSVSGFVTLNWNDNAATIQTQLQSLAGSNLASSGILNPGGVTINLLDVSDVGLFYIVDDTLQDSSPASVAVKITTEDNYFIEIEGQNFQLLFKEENMILYTESDLSDQAVQIFPTAVNVDAGEDYQFQSYGGYGSPYYSVAGSGTIDPDTGLYTAPGFPASDEVRVQYGIFDTASILQFFARADVAVV